MFKGMLLVLLISSCGAMGLIKGAAFKNRVNELNYFIRILLIIKSEISYRKIPLPILLKQISLDEYTMAGKILKTSCSYMAAGYTFEQAWNQALNKICNTSCFTQDDIAVLKDIGSYLGKSDINGQNENLILSIEKIKNLISEANIDRKTKGKMYSGMGFSIGIVIAILLI